VANMVSYEVPMVVALLIPVIITGTMSVKGITEFQSGIWLVILSPLAAVIFIISAIAELGRAPFDLTEAESELTAGFNVEYSGMKFGWFYASELLHAFTFGGFIAILFFGGYNFFGLEKFPLLGAVIFLTKALFFYWVIMWVKYSMPRIRIDHMLAFSWKFLTPLSLALLIITAVMDKLLAPTNFYVAGMFLTNVVIAWATIEILRAYSKRQRQAEEASIQPVAEAAPH